MTSIEQQLEFFIGGDNFHLCSERNKHSEALTTIKTVPSKKSFAPTKRVVQEFQTETNHPATSIWTMLSASSVAWFHRHFWVLQNPCRWTLKFHKWRPSIIQCRPHRSPQRQPPTLTPHIFAPGKSMFDVESRIRRLKWWNFTNLHGLFNLEVTLSHLTTQPARIWWKKQNLI